MAKHMVAHNDHVENSAAWRRIARGSPITTFTMEAKNTDFVFFK